MVERVSQSRTERDTMSAAAAASKLPRRRPVARHPGIYYRPRTDGKVAPPYEISYLDSTGKRRWQVVHGNLDAAEAKRAELRLRRRRGERIEPSRQTFEQYAQEWLERQTARERTLEVYQWALRQHLNPYFGRRRLDQITVDDVAAFIAAMQRKGLRGSTIHTALRPLSRILAHAARRGAIPLNPCSQLERGERPSLTDQRPKRILTLEEMRALIAAADSPHSRCLLELLLTTGLRIGEALGLTIGDLDREHSLIRIEAQLGRDGSRTPLKTPESRRTIDIPPELMRRLLALTATRGALFNPDALLLASRNGTGLERKTARNALKRATKTAQITTPHPTLHDLRHTHASMLIALDIPLVDVQRRLGHRKPDTTLRIYAHEWKERDARRSRIGQQLSQLLDEPTRSAETPTKQLALPSTATRRRPAEAARWLSIT
jgi:integrase